jgi:hypothetical protein
VGLGGTGHAVEVVPVGGKSVAGGPEVDCSATVRSCSNQLAARLCAVRRSWLEACTLPVVESRYAIGNRTTIKTVMATTTSRRANPASVVVSPNGPEHEPCSVRPYRRESRLARHKVSTILAPTVTSMTTESGEAHRDCYLQLPGVSRRLTRCFLPR